MTALTLFASTFVLVFALGFQSLNVNNGHYLAAALTSFVIGAMQIIVLKLGPDASVIEAVAFVAGGPFGIIASMWAHRRTIGKRRRSSNINRATEEIDRVGGYQPKADWRNFSRELPDRSGEAPPPRHP